jgi:hypothetical protein
MTQSLVNAEIGLKLTVGGPFSDVIYKPNLLTIPGFDENLKVK